MFINCVCHNSVKSAIRGERVGGGREGASGRQVATEKEEGTPPYIAALASVRLLRPRRP